MRATSRASFAASTYPLPSRPGGSSSPIPVPGIGTWKESFDLAFDTLPSQGPFSPDGTYLIDGFEFVKSNSANEAALLTLVNGQGLIWQPAAASFYDIGTATDTLPRLWLSLEQFVPAAALDWDTSLRIWTYWSTDNLTALGDAEVFGIDNDSLSAPTGSVVGRGFYPAAENLVLQSASDAAISAPLNATTRVMMLEIDHIGQLEGRLLVAAPTGVTVWPALNALQPELQASGTSPLPANITPPPGTGLGIVLGCQRNGSLTPLSCTLTRLRVDYKGNP